MKKALSLFLATLMLISVFSLSVSAAAMPVISEAVATYDGVKLEWSAVAGASGYVILREDGSGNEPIVAGKTSATTFVDKDVAYGRTYTYAVAVNSANPEVDFGRGAEVTYNHVMVKSVKKNSDAVTLTWAAVSGNVEYAIFRQDDPNKRPTCIATTKSASFADTDVVYGGEYKYAIAIREADGGYDVLDFDNAIVVNYDVVDLKVPTVSGNGIVLEWSAVKGATEYLVYRRTGGVAQGELIATTTDLSYVDTKVVDGKYYAYVIVAKDANYDANAAIDYTTGRLIQYQNFVFKSNVSSFSGLKITWTAMANATNYYVYRVNLVTGETGLVATTTDAYYMDTDVVNGATYLYAVAIQYKNGKLVAADFDNAYSARYSRPICSRVSSGIHKYYESDECVIDAYASVYAPGAKHYVCPICGDESAQYVIPQLAPEAPSITVLSNTYSGVYIKWNKVDGADLYAVYRRGVNSGWELLKVLVGDSMFDANVQTGQYYRYAVRAIRRTDYVASVVTTSGSSKVITWNTIPGTANAYYVYRKDNASSNFWNTLAYVAGTNAKNGKISFTDSKPNPNAKGYLVRGMMASNLGESKYLRAVATPKGLTATNNATGILFKWNKVAGATGYRVYRKADGASEWTYLTTTKNLFYPDYKVENGVTYTYAVRAVCDGWYSDYIRAGVSILRLGNPELLEAAALSKGINVKWAAVDGATGYRVYRKTANSTWVLVGTVKGARVSYIDTSAVAGVKYTYTVRATNGSYISNYDAAGISCKK